MNGESADHPLASPLFANLEGLPPMLIQVGSDETLLDDSTELAQNLRDAGIDVSLDVWDEMFHVWQYYSQWIPEGEEAIDELAAYALSKIG